jgi:dihydrofolate reductase
MQSDLLLGRKTYDIFAAHWPFVKNDPDKLNAMAADKLNSARKYVVSRTLDKADWQNSALIKDDAAKEILELKKTRWTRNSSPWKRQSYPDAFEE